jgi:hypothetical protein
VPISQFSSLVPLIVCLVTMLAASRFDPLFGADPPIGSVWLDATAPTLSPKPLHSLVVSSNWRTKMQCKSDPVLHYWKSCTGLPTIYLTSKAMALNPTTNIVTMADVRLHQLCTEPIGCILLIVKAVSSGSYPFIMLVTAPCVGGTCKVL